MIKTEGSRALSQWNREYPSLTCYKGPNFNCFFLVVWRRCQRKRSIKRKVSPFLYILWTWSIYFKSILKFHINSFQWNVFVFHFTDKIFPQEIVTDVHDSTTTKCKRTLKVFQLSIVSLPVGGLIHREDQWKTRVSLGVIILIGWRG